MGIRRTKGQCFWCDEKYTPGHKWPRKQLVIIEVGEDIELENESIEEQLTNEDDGINPQIYVHAFTGSFGY